MEGLRAHTAGGRGRRIPALSRAIALCGALLSACGSSPTPRLVVEDALYDPRPSRRTEAVVQIARERRLEKIPDLIELLEDPDPAVRMAASATLQDLTGRESAYRPWAQAADRRRHVEAWRAWWRDQGHPPVGTPGRPPALRPARGGGS